jgi:hypothetical protein
MIHTIVISISVTLQDLRDSKLTSLQSHDDFLMGGSVGH